MINYLILSTFKYKYLCHLNDFSKKNLIFEHEEITNLFAHRKNKKKKQKYTEKQKNRKNRN